MKVINRETYNRRMGKVIALVITLLMVLFLTACKETELISVEETKPFTFEAPSQDKEEGNKEGQEKNDAAETAGKGAESSTIQRETPATESRASGKDDSDSEEAQNIETSAGVANQTGAGTEQRSEPPREITSSLENMDDVPLYAQLADASINEEPSVPMSVPSGNPIRGVAGTKAERFFRTLSTEPVTYHYVLLPGEEVEGWEKETVEVYLALSGGKAYMRVSSYESDLALLQLSESNYYQMDLQNMTYVILPGLSTTQNELSMGAFRQIEANAENFVDTGKGSAVFFGKRVQFEEFTADGERYVRYYFIGDVLVGHRSFEDGKITQTVRVYEASNRYDENLFQLPEGLSQVSDTVAERNRD